MQKINFDEISKETLIDLLRMYSDLFYVLDGLWFLTTEEMTDYETAIKIDIETWKKYGRKEAKRLRSLFNVQDNSLETAMKLLIRGPYMFQVDCYYEMLSDTEAILYVTHCRTLEAMKKAGRKKFVCGPVSEAYYSAFVKEINPNIIWRPIRHPPEYMEGCEWHFSI